MTVTAIVPFVPDLFELILGGLGVWSWGYVKGARRRRLPR